jgi:uncharacterized protein (DUF58 family)
MLLSYLLAGMFITAMMKSFFNLAGLCISANPDSYGHAEQAIYFPLVLNSKKTRFALHFSFASFPYQQQPQIRLSESDQGEMYIQVPFNYANRGRYSPGRLKISSEYCFGLFTTWTHLDFDFQAIVYPQKKIVKSTLASLISAQQESISDSAVVHQVKGSDDFYELKNYINGEPLSGIAWKQLAKGQGKFSKHYQQNKVHPDWLIMHNMPGRDKETKLQQLCFLVVQFSNTGQVFGLELRNVQIAPASGELHKQKCLLALTDFAG